MRVGFLGNAPWSVPTLEALASAADVEIPLVITNPARPAGRGSRLRRTSVAEAAEGLDLMLLEVDGVRAGPGFEAIADLDPDALVVVAYGELLTPDVLAVPRLGVVNVHFSLLPRWRGASPVQRAILEGDDVTGVSIMLMDEGLDTGPVLEVGEEPIETDDDAGSLGDRLARAGALLLLDTLRALEAGTAHPEPQGQEGATQARRLGPADRHLDWTGDPSVLTRRVRALSPSPGAVATFRGAPLKVMRAEPVIPEELPPEAGARPGVVRVGPDGVPRVDTPSGQVRLLDVAPADRTRMSGADWARGARIQPGERLT
jgi:methionyl-tRNA formyltransferase